MQTNNAGVAARVVVERVLDSAVLVAIAVGGILVILDVVARDATGCIVALSHHDMLPDIRVLAAICC